MDVMLAYTDFDRPYAAPRACRRNGCKYYASFERMLKDIEFAAEAKKLWTGTEPLI